MNGAANTPEEPSQQPDTEQVGAGIDFTDPNSKLARFYFQTPHVLAVLLIGLIASLSSFIPLWHTDVWAHMKYGDWMLEHRTIPQEEPFSPWWDGTVPFTQFYTVSQLAIALVYRFGASIAGGDELNQMAGGVDALRTLHGLLQGLRLLVLWFAFRRVSSSLTTAFAGLVLVVLVDSVNISVFRPQVFAQLYFALLLFFFSGPLKWRSVVCIPLFLAIWANTHGSYIVALAFITMNLIGHIIEQISTPRQLLNDRKTYQLLFALMGSVIAIGLLNPYGFSYYSRTLALTSHTSLNLGITEWQPLAFAWSMDWHWVLMATLLILAVTFYRSPKACPPAHWLLIVVIAAGMALQLRFVIWWAMLVPWIAAPHWAALQSRVNEGDAPQASFRKTLLALAVAWSVFMWSTPAAWLRYSSPTPVKQGASAGTPWELSQVLLQKPLPAQSAWTEQLQRTIQTNYPGQRFCGSVFASPQQGDFLMWAISPQIPVTYTHMHLFPPEFWRELGYVAGGVPGWSDVLEHYGVNLLIFEPFICPRLIEALEKHPDWLIILDERETKQKLLNFNKHFIAIRLKPLQPKFADVGGRR
jgi:hypothetical protein